MSSLLLIRWGLLSIVCMLFMESACRNNRLRLDEISSPPTPSLYTGPLINSFSLENTTSSTTTNKANLLPGNVVSFPACPSVCTLLKVNDSNANKINWTYELKGKDVDTFFTVKRKEKKDGKDSSNFFLICTKKLSASTTVATLNLLGKDPENGQTITLASIGLRQEGIPIDSVKVEKACCQSGTPPPSTCPTTTTTTPTQSVNTLLNCTSGTTTPVYIQQKSTTSTDKIPTDSLVFGKDGSKDGKKVYLKIKNVFKTSSTNCQCCTPQNENHYATNDILWTASAYSAGEWLKIKGISSNTPSTTDVGVRGTKQTKCIEVEVSENNTNTPRTDGLIILRAGSTNGTTTFKVNVYQQKGTTTSSR